MTGERQGGTRGEGLGATRWGKLEGQGGLEPPRCLAPSSASGARRGAAGADLECRTFSVLWFNRSGHRDKRGKMRRGGVD
jgi:hypothetical protein